jgi:hypothetical protein
MTERGLSERRALTVIGMSASALRYVPAPDRNAALRARIVALAHRHRRYGVGMIHLKLQQAGLRVNAKRVHRLYVEERLQIRRRRRKTVPVADRQPLVKPTAPTDVWSADFVFDRTAEGRVLKCLAIVDDATTEAVALIPARDQRSGGDAGARSTRRNSRTAARAPDRQRAIFEVKDAELRRAGALPVDRHHDRHPDGFRHVRKDALTIVTEGRANGIRPARASYSVAIQAEGPSIIYEVVSDASTARGEGILPPGLVASGKRR